MHAAIQHGVPIIVASVGGQQGLPKDHDAPGGADSHASLPSLEELMVTLANIQKVNYGHVVETFQKYGMSTESIRNTYTEVLELPTFELCPTGGELELSQQVDSICRAMQPHLPVQIELPVPSNQAGPALSAASLSESAQNCLLIYNQYTQGTAARVMKMLLQDLSCPVMLTQDMHTDASTPAGESDTTLQGDS